MSLSTIALLLAAGQPVWVPPPPTEFQNGTWGPIRLGVSRDADLKAALDAGKGTVRPEGLLVPTHPESGIRVDVLMQGRGRDALARAVRIQYRPGVSPSLDSVAELWGPPRIAFAPIRWEDWAIMAWPDRGVAVESRRVADENGSPVWRPEVWFLASPDRLDAALAPFVAEETPVTRPPDPGEDWDGIYRYRFVRASVSMDNSPVVPADLTRRRLEELQRLLIDDLGRRVPGPIAGNGDRGTISANVRFGGINREGESKVTVSVTLEAETPYGTRRLSASEERVMTFDFRRRARDLVDSAFANVVRRIDDDRRRLGPPEVGERREQGQQIFMNILAGAVGGQESGRGR
ncbi:MAG: hypothetical protein MH204_02845 [Fimbriimonadaceae bacterium]|nr:hypothetical protein [Fimbriimonadaceae bacterium]